MKVTILSENYASKVNCAEWGFSALVETDNSKILFDTGQSGDCVINNAKELGVNLNSIDSIILSHGHYDHTGGLEKIINLIGEKKIYSHSNIFLNRYTVKDSEKKHSNPIVKLPQNIRDMFTTCDQNIKINKNIHLICNIPASNNFESISNNFIKEEQNKLIQDDFSDELVLVIDSAKGLIIISGCSHRGIVNICNHAKKLLNKNIFAVIGGTHLYNASDEYFNQVINYFKNEKIEILSPAHCTGIDKVFKFKSILGDKVIPAFCGEVINLD